MTAPWQGGGQPQTQSDEELLCWLWLVGVLGTASEDAGKLMDLYGSARAVYRARETEDLSPWLRGVAKTRLRTTEPEDHEKTLRLCRERGIRVIPYDDPDYPLALCHIPDPPLVLYCTGQPACLTASAYVGMVGTRRPTQYGVEACRTLAGDMAAAGAVIVSGLADGLDGESHRAALAREGLTIGVLGCCIDHTYPAANQSLRTKMEEQGAVLSEYPPGFAAANQKFMFLQRNRLIAALSGALCVLEARAKSGTLNTVGHAERYGKPVLALPGSIFSPMSQGTNQLLAQGRAKALVCAEDALRLVGLHAAGRAAARPRARQPRLSPAEERLMACMSASPKTMEALCAECGLPVGELLGALTGLELAGRITALPGRRYLLK